MGWNLASAFVHFTCWNNAAIYIECPTFEAYIVGKFVDIWLHPCSISLVALQIVTDPDYIHVDI